MFFGMFELLIILFVLAALVGGLILLVVLVNRNSSPRDFED
jgi:uncharacterized integral membrane protein